MTVRELKNEVYSLARLPIGEADGLFMSSLRRALLRIYAELKISDTKRLYITPCHQLSKIPQLIHYKGETKTLPLTGRAYSLKVSGKGYFTVRDGLDVLRYDFDSEEIRFCGFIKNGGEISFCGDYAYTVYDFVTYSSSFSDREEDIPDGSPYRTIDINLGGDFLMPLSYPTDRRGVAIKGMSIWGTKLTFAADFSGEVYLKYVKMPKKCTDSDEDIIDLPPNCSALLAPLVASLILIDDDYELSEKYERIYQTSKNELGGLYTSHSAEYVMTEGWA